jgi:hypothetical protein
MSEYASTIGYGGAVNKDYKNGNRNKFATFYQSSFVSQLSVHNIEERYGKIMWLSPRQL